METLAQLAASQNEINASDGETYIEKYIKGVSAVESILTLDRLRQVSVARLSPCDTGQDYTDEICSWKGKKKCINILAWNAL